MRPSKRIAKAVTGAVCFMCQETSDGFETRMRLLSGELPHSKSLLLSKIESLLGNNFRIYIEKDDVICECCYKLLVNIDRMETVLKTFLCIKYNLDDENSLILVTDDDPLELSKVKHADIFNVAIQEEEEGNEGKVNDESEDIEALINHEPIVINVDHNYHSQSDLNNPEQDQHNDETYNDLESGDINCETSYDSLPESSKIVPIDLVQHELAIAKAGDGPFKCAKCKRAFTGVHCLRNHLLLHGKPVTCRICCKLAPDKILLKIHLQQVHMKKVDKLKAQGWTKPLALTCPHCGYQAITMNNLVRHIKSHDRKLALPDKVLKRERKPLVHKDEKNTDDCQPQAEFNIDFEDSFQILEEANADINDITLTTLNDLCEIPENQTPKCTTVEADVPQRRKRTPSTDNPAAAFILDASNDDLELHIPAIRIVQVDSQRTHACPTCPLKFTCKGNLTQHMKGHRPNPRTCRICDEELADRVLYKLHLRKEHYGNISAELLACRNADGDGFKCPECGKLVMRAANLQMHMKMHSNVLTFKCQTCLEVFQDREALRDHWVTAHPQLRLEAETSRKGPASDLDALQCRQCQTQLASASSLCNHMLGHNGVPATCKRCQETFPDKLFLRKHQRETHYEMLPVVDSPGNKLDKFACQLCGSKFATRFNLRYHLHRHDDRPVKCTRCGETLQDRLFLLNHTKKVHFNTLVAQNEALNETLSEELRCKVCSKQLTSIRYLQQHAKGHDPATGPLECRICGIQLADRLHRLVHMKAEHLGCVQPQYRCDLCPAAFHGKMSVLRHIRAKHGDLTCVFCGEACATRRLLRAHERLHEPKEGEALPCSQCAKTFPSTDTLRRHKRRHQLELHHLCSVCGKSFAFANSLEEHMGSHQQAERYTCEKCGRAFVYISSLRMHLKWHDNPYPYLCKHEGCDRRFKTQSHMANHRRTAHSTLRPYVCDFCPKTFNVKTTCKRHVMTHTRDFQYKCELCTYGATRSNYLATHYKRVHGEQGKADALKRKCEYKLCLRPEEIAQESRERADLAALDNEIFGAILF